jgi:hypothetical protein
VSTNRVVALAAMCPDVLLTFTDELALPLPGWLLAARLGTEVVLAVLALFDFGVVRVIHEHWCCYASTISWLKYDWGTCTNPDAAIFDKKHDADRQPCDLHSIRALEIAAWSLTGVAGLALLLLLLVSVLVYTGPAASGATAYHASDKRVRRLARKLPLVDHLPGMAGHRPLAKLARGFAWSPCGALCGSGLWMDRSGGTLEHVVHTGMGLVGVGLVAVALLLLSPHSVGWWAAMGGAAALGSVVYSNNWRHWASFVARARRAHVPLPEPAASSPTQYAEAAVRRATTKPNTTTRSIPQRT